MKFNEAIDEVRSHENTYDETSGTMQTFSVLDMIDELREEYAPTIEMTSEEKEGIITGLKYKNEYNSPFANFSETYRRINQNWGDRMYINLTEEQLMQAWLNPNSIQIIDEE